MYSRVAGKVQINVDRTKAGSEIIVVQGDIEKPRNEFHEKKGTIYERGLE